MGVVNCDLTFNLTFNLTFDSFDKYSFEMMHNLEKASDKFEIESQMTRHVV